MRCITCSSPLQTHQLPVCPVCLNTIEKVDPKEAENHLEQINSSQIPIHSVYTHWYFDHAGTLQNLHQYLKYGNRPSYGIALGTLMGHGLKAYYPSSVPELLIPIPLHRRRLLQRGYNQSTLLAKGIAEVIEGSLIEDVLVRKRSTRSQTGLTHEERQQNVAAAFSTKKPERITKKHILLIDDVMTTGATILSAAKALHEAGAGPINVATLAFTRR
ncbi:MAG: ComF family protein [Rhodothermaceae bacterium]|nr:ComF family protein [Rhodothermaceae bacterium]